MEKREPSEKKAEIVGKGLTPKVLITWLLVHTLIFTIVNIYDKGLLRTETFITATETGIPQYAPWGFYFLFVFIIIPISIALTKNLPFSKQELAILFSLMYMSLFTAVFVDSVGAGLWYRFIPETAGVPSEYIPDYFAPADFSLVEGTWLGKASVPWGPLMPFISFWTVVAICYFIFYLSLSEIMRRKFIEIDRLSYPGIVPSYEVIRMATEFPTMVASETKSSRLPSLFNVRLNKWFYIGFFTLGLGFGMPTVLSYTFPELGIPTFAYAGRYPVYPLSQFFATNTWHIGGDARWVPTDCFMMFLVPMDVLATMVLYQFIAYVVWPVIGTATGIMAPGVSGSTYWMAAGPFRARLFASAALFGLGIWAPILSWRYIKDSLAKAFKHEKVAEGEVQPLWGWLGAIIAGLVLLGVGLGLGAPAALIVLILAVYAVYSIGTNYFFGEGMPFGYTSYGQTFSQGIVCHAGSAMGYFPTPATLSQASWGTGAFQYIYFAHNTDITETVFIGYQMQNYKLAAMTETKPKEMYKAMLIACFLIPLISIPIFMWLFYDWGVVKILTWYGPNSWQNEMADSSLAGVTKPFSYWDVEYQANVLGSIIVTGILMILRTRFAWFFIHPIGIVNMYVFRNLTEGLPILIVKYLMIRMGGAKAYERIGVPLFAGALVGVTFFIGLGFLEQTIRAAFISPPY